jgi:hypothetical protein
MERTGKQICRGVLQSKRRFSLSLSLQILTTLCAPSVVGCEQFPLFAPPPNPLRVNRPNERRFCGHGDLLRLIPRVGNAGVARQELLPSGTRSGA